MTWGQRSKVMVELGGRPLAPSSGGRNFEVVRILATPDLSFTFGANFLHDLEVKGQRSKVTVELCGRQWVPGSGGRNSEVARILATPDLSLIFGANFLHDLGVKGQRSRSNLVGDRGCKAAGAEILKLLAFWRRQT